MPAIPNITLANGYKMPVFGLGTHLAAPGMVEKAVMEAIDLGYRLIDTALVYGNEKEIGTAIKAKIEDGTVKREDLFITTKLWNNRHKQESVVPACKMSLENLGLTYIDLYLIHSPVAFADGDELTPLDANGEAITTNTDYLETWRGMEECVRLGLAHSIGVSNFNSEQITRILGMATIIPVNNQIEVNINLNQSQLIEFCKKHSMSVTAFSPLGKPGNTVGVPNFLNHQTITDLAKKYKKSPPQIALRYVLQQGTCIIPKTVTSSRLQENMEIFDFELTADEMAAIAENATGERVVRLRQMVGHKYYPFTIPF